MPSNVGTASPKKWVEKIGMKWTWVDVFVGVIQIASMIDPKSEKVYASREKSKVVKQGLFKFAQILYE